MKRGQHLHLEKNNGFQFDRAKQKFAAVCVKAIQEDSALEDDGPIEPLDIACEFLEEPEKAFALSHGSLIT